MNLMNEINAYRNSPEQQRARTARRAVRDQVIYGRIGLAIGRPSAVRQAQFATGPMRFHWQARVSWHGVPKAQSVASYLMNSSPIDHRDGSFTMQGAEPQPGSGSIQLLDVEVVYENADPDITNEEVMGADLETKIRSDFDEVLQEYFAEVSDAIPAVQTRGLMRTAQRWNMSSDDSVSDGALIGSQHPGAAALLVVRQALSQFNIPNEPALRYGGMKRASGHSAFAVDEGIIFIEATLRSQSGPRHHLEVPVVVREGRVLAPSVVMHEGRPRVMCQSSFDAILGMGEFTQAVPDRENMYRYPAAGQTPSKRVPIVRDNIFSMDRGGPSRGVSASLIKSAVRGFYVAAAPSHVSVDEMSGEQIMSFIEMEIESEQQEGRECEVSYEVPAEVRAAADEWAQTFNGILNYWLDKNPPPDGFEYEMENAAYLALHDMQGSGIGLWDHWDHFFSREQLKALGDALERHPAARRAEERFMNAIRNAVYEMCPDEGEDPGDDDGGGESPRPPQFLRQQTPSEEAPRMQANRGGRAVATQENNGPTSRNSGAGAARTAFYSADVTGLRAADDEDRGVQSVPEGPHSHLDPAERPVWEMFAPGDEVKTKAEVVSRNRGGVAYRIPKGAKGKVIRDVDGADYAYLVRFADGGHVLVVPKAALA